MAAFRAAAVLAIFAMAGLTHAQTLPPGVGSSQVQPVQVVQPTVGASNQGDQPTLKQPDQVFHGDLEQPIVGSLDAGARDGEPVNDLSIEPVGKVVGRKLLQVTGNLKLDGTGQELGSSTAGEQGKVFGQGRLNGPEDTHIQPHGYEGDVSAAGQGVNGITAQGNPDGLAGEGPVLTAGKRLF